MQSEDAKDPARNFDECAKVRGRPVLANLKASRAGAAEIDAAYYSWFKRFDVTLSPVLLTPPPPVDLELLDDGGAPAGRMA